MKTQIMAIIGLIFFVGLSALACWKIVGMIYRSENRPQLIIKWLVSGFLCYGIYRAAYVGPLGLLIGIVLGLILGVMWARDIGNMIANPFSSLYDGGDQELDERPLYAMAEARRKRGDYLGAVKETNIQLVRFPTDFTGLMLLAEIQAENLKDLPSAKEVIERILDTKGESPKNLAFALNRLADWQLKIGMDQPAARTTIERIANLLPDSEQAQLAFQRMAHLDAGGPAKKTEESKPIALKNFDSSIGLRDDSADLSPVEEDPAVVAARFVKLIDQHPHDYEAREKLAAIYADHYQRLDLASDQLEYLIAQPHQPAKQVVHWLNLLADFQVRLTLDANVARKTLERIVDLFPDAAASQNARNRIAYLSIEVKPKEPNQPVKLGSYEQNIGLKRGKSTE